MRQGIYKALITGGAGFIGSNFIRYLMSTYPRCRVVNLDKLTYAGNPDNLKGLQGDPRYAFVKGDICDSAVVNRAIKGCDIVVNFAAETHVDRSIVSSDEFLRTNAEGVKRLLEASRRHGVRKFIHISTDEVYGSIRKGSFTETSPLNPSSPYSASKAAGDLLALSYFKTYGLPVVITRSSNNYGPYQYPEKIIPLFITNALEDKPLPVYGKGLNVRDWIFVEDNCRGIDTVMRKGRAGEAYNIGGGCETTNNELTDIILRAMHKPKDLLRYVTDRPGHDFRYSLDCSKLAKLGWRPKYDVREGLKLTIRWYVSEQAWWKKIKCGGTFKAHHDKWYSKRR